MSLRRISSLVTVALAAVTPFSAVLAQASVSITSSSPTCPPGVTGTVSANTSCGTPSGNGGATAQIGGGADGLRQDQVSLDVFNRGISTNTSTWVEADSRSAFSDALVVSGSITPSTVVFYTMLQYSINVQTSGSVTNDVASIVANLTYGSQSTDVSRGLSLLAPTGGQNLNANAPSGYTAFSFSYLPGSTIFRLALSADANIQEAAFANSSNFGSARINGYFDIAAVDILDAQGRSIVGDQVAFASGATYFTVGDPNGNPNGQVDASQVTATPEPATLTLMFTGFAGVIGAARRRRSRAELGA